MAGYGSIRMNPVGEVTVGTRVTLEFEYTVGAEGIAEGGSLRVGLPNCGWEMPLVPMHRYFQKGMLQGEDLYDRGYCTYARCNTTVALRSNTGAWVDLSVDECHAAEANEAISLVDGD